MNLKFIFLISFILVSFSAMSSQRVRRVEVSGDQIVTVRTSIGIATIIQVPDRPNSVVVGDQDSFKVEYLDQAITIKPLSPGAKSNLYVYTDWKRFNVELISGAQASADYVVYLTLPAQKKKTDPPIAWKSYKNSLQNENLNLHVKRIGSVKNGLLLVEFEITSSKNEKLNPEWIWLTQEGVVKPIQSLVFSSLEVSKDKPAKGLIQLRIVDFEKAQLRLEIRRKKLSYLTLPKIDSWVR